MNSLVLKAIRLVGFHNFDDVTVEIKGDLFILGANESGKTTILDAIQLALSGEQGLDWNAAAKVVGSKRDGRTLKGVILRADLAGNPHPDRAEGGISYVALEFHPNEKTGGIQTLVFGALARNMESRVTTWGAIAHVPAADLPLTRPASDESAGLVILDRDEFEKELGTPIFKRIDTYREDVARLLFSSREYFDEATRLWQTAKSYKEMALAARDISGLFRRVLPAPDPEPFRKIRKAFNDIREIEIALGELKQDVAMLQRLREALKCANEAREAYQRYEYIKAKRQFDSIRDQLSKTRAQAESNANDLERHRLKAQDLQNQIEALGERICALQASEAFGLGVALSRQEEEFRKANDRLERARAKAAQARQELEACVKKSEAQRKRSQDLLENLRRTLRTIGEEFAAAAPALQESFTNLSALLPEGIDVHLDEENIRTAERGVHLAIGKLRQDNDLSRRDGEEVLRKVTADLVKARKAISEIERYEDAIPDLPGLSEALDALRQKGIEARLLCQFLEFREGLSDEIQRIAEAALGQPCLGTVIAAPECVATARECVLAMNSGVRVLDAVAVKAANSQPPPGNSIRPLDLLSISDARVRGHLEALFGGMILRREEPPDGQGGEWILTDGTRAEEGARWKVLPPEPCLIGVEARRKHRAQMLLALREQEQQLENLAGSTKDRIDALNNRLKDLNNWENRLSQLRLPDDLGRNWEQMEYLAKGQEDAKGRCAEHEEVLMAEEQIRLGAKTLLEDLKKRTEQSDVASVQAKVRDLQRDEKDARNVLRQQDEEKGRLEKTKSDLDFRLAKMTNDLEEGERGAEKARMDLLALLPFAAQADLDHYVYETKQGSRIRPENLEERIREAISRKAETYQSLTGSGGDGVLNPKLVTRYHFRVEDQGTLCILDPDSNPLERLLDQRREQEREWNESLTKNRRDLFENLLAGDLAARLREDQRRLKQKTLEFNAVLDPLVFGHSHYRMDKSVRDNESKRIVDMLDRRTVLDPAARAEWIQYLENHPELNVGEDEVPAFLDYRNWYEFKFVLRESKSSKEGSVGSEDLVRGSGGAQGTHQYLLLFALAAMLFNKSKARIRLLMIDEAFYGLDAERKELLLHCAKKLDLGFVIATPDLDGTILGEKHDSTTVMVDKDEQQNVVVIPFHWEGDKLQADLFEKPHRPEAIIGPKNPA